jgi:DNA invertase Pin-like site-specific DNA recombinase
MSTTCLLAWAAVLLLLPITLILWFTESRSTRINRLRRSGYTWAAIATRYGVSPTTVRRWATA